MTKTNQIIGRTFKTFDEAAREAVASANAFKRLYTIVKAGNRFGYCYDCETLDRSAIVGVAQPGTVKAARYL